MVESGNEKKLESIDKNLQSQEENKRKLGVCSLGKIDDQKALPVLIKAMQHKHKEVRAAAFSLLWRSRPVFNYVNESLEILEPLLVKAAKDRAKQVRYEVNHALTYLCYTSHKLFESYLRLSGDNALEELEEENYCSGYQIELIDHSTILPIENRFTISDALPYIANKDAKIRKGAIKFIGLFGGGKQPANFNLTEILSGVLDGESNEEIIIECLQTLKKWDVDKQEKINLIFPFWERSEGVIKDLAAYELADAGDKRVAQYMSERLLEEIGNRDIDFFVSSLKKIDAFQMASEMISVYLENNEDENKVDYCIKVLEIMGDSSSLLCLQKALKSGLPFVRVKILRFYFDDSIAHSIFLFDTLLNVFEYADSASYQNDLKKYNEAEDRYKIAEASKLREYTMQKIIEMCGKTNEEKDFFSNFLASKTEEKEIRILAILGLLNYEDAEVILEKFLFKFFKEKKYKYIAVVLLMYR